MSKKQFLLYLLSLFTVTLLQAATGTKIDMKPLAVDPHDQAKLQRGAKIYMNYCSGCHSLRYLRYNRMAQDLGLTTFAGQLDTDLLVSNLIFTKAKISEPIQISMPAADARQWFGMIPPDLSLTARQRGASWLYAYLKGFYADKSRPFGANNLLVPDVAMPNILAPLQGEVARVNQEIHPDGSLILLATGEMSQQQFDKTLEDLISFLVYVGEPAQLVRYRIGIVVIIFLAIFLVVAYLLKKMYWKNI